MPLEYILALFRSADGWLTQAPDLKAARFALCRTPSTARCWQPAEAGRLLVGCAASDGIDVVMRRACAPGSRQQPSPVRGERCTTSFTARRQFARLTARSFAPSRLDSFHPGSRALDWGCSDFLHPRSPPVWLAPRGAGQLSSSCTLMFNGT